MKTKTKFFLLSISMFITAPLFFGVEKVSAATVISNDITVPTIWTKENSPYIVQNFIHIKAPMTIEPGVVVKFKPIMPSLVITGLSVESSFTAVGNVLEKIIFTSACDGAFIDDGTKAFCLNPYALRGDWDGIRVIPESKSPVSIEHAKISYADNGITHETIHSSDSFKFLSVKNTEIENSYSAGIFLRYTQPTLDGLILQGNRYGIQVYAANADKAPKIRNSVIASNSDSGVRADNASSIDARYNFWGDASGPYRYYGNGSYDPGDNADGKGNRIVGKSAIFIPWDRSDPTVPKESVIFIPGIGASLNPDLMISGVLSNNWTMFDHTYDGILQAFKVMGYQEGKNFFIAYYDWRKSNNESAEKFLKPIIEKALAKSDATKVNIVTHSMGSLVARSYVQSDAYKGDVHNLIMIAPPNKGSSDVYAAWEGGYIPKNWDSDWLMRAYINYLKITNNNFSSYDIIHKYIPSLKELMPTYDFLKQSGDVKNFLSMSEKNNFLLDLNTDVEKLNARTRFSIILGDTKPTVNKIPVIDSDKSGIWADGKPDPIDPVQNDENGDGEVLISSGDTLSAFRDVLAYGHREIVSKSEKIVAERLGENLDDTFDSPEIDDEMIVWTDAPGELEITDPDGKVVSRGGSSIDNSIYSQDDSKDGFKIVSVPNVKKGDYDISIKANEGGEHVVGVEYVDHTGKNEDQSKSQAIEIKKDETQNFVVPTDPENKTEPVAEIALKDEIEPIVKIESPKDGEEYANDKILPISFLVSDNVSKVEKIQTEIYLDDDLIEGKSIDLSKLSPSQTHDFWINAIDEAGNWGFDEVFFKIKKAETPVVVAPDPPPAVDPPIAASPPVVVEEKKDPVATPVAVEPAAPPATPVAIQVVPAQENTVQNSDDHESKKHKKSKAKSKNNLGKTNVVVGIRKSHEKIKVISSTTNLPKGFQHAPDVPNATSVLGANDERILEENPESLQVQENLAPSLDEEEGQIDGWFQARKTGTLFDLLNFEKRKWLSFLGKLSSQDSHGQKVGNSEASLNQNQPSESIQRNRISLLTIFIVALLFLASLTFDRKKSPRKFSNQPQ